MILTPVQTLITILAIALGTIITRFLPFIIFPEKKQTPMFVVRLGKLLPPAMMGLLVVYCFKSVSFVTVPFGFPEIIATVLTGVLHLWRKNVFLSIGAGTVCYMILVQLVFV